MLIRKTLLFYTSAFLLIVGTVPTHAMAPDTVLPGTVIDPLHYNGSFTVNALANINTQAFPLQNTATEQLEKIVDITHQKGIPVLVAFGASRIPWWALTTGTGLLLLSQASSTDPVFLQTFVEGLGYAGGESIQQEIPNHIKNSLYVDIVQDFLIISMYTASYFCPEPYLQAALTNAATAALTQGTLRATMALFYPLKNESSETKPVTETSTTTNQSSYYQTLAGIVVAGGATLVNPLEVAKIFLYEQAYRLAKKGIASAQQLMGS